MSPLSKFSLSLPLCLSPSQPQSHHREQTQNPTQPPFKPNHSTTCQPSTAPPPPATTIINKTTTTQTHHPTKITQISLANFQHNPLPPLPIQTQHNPNWHESANKKRDTPLTLMKWRQLPHCSSVRVGCGCSGPRVAPMLPRAILDFEQNVAKSLISLRLSLL